jgi:hypothetical protein
MESLIKRSVDNGYAVKNSKSPNYNKGTRAKVKKSIETDHINIKEKNEKKTKNNKKREYNKF